MIREQPRQTKSDAAQKKQVFQLQDHLLKNYYLDVKDFENVWRLARIVQRDDKFVTIRLDAFDAKFEEQLHFSSHRLAPLRRHSEGYTGSRRNVRDIQPKLQTIGEIRTRLDLLLGEEIPSQPAYEITQFLRGELFVLIDGLLSSRYLNQAEVKQIGHFLEYYVGFVVRFCEKCLILTEQHFDDFISSKEAYLTNPFSALLASLQELLYSLLLIFLLRGEPRNELYQFSQAHSEEWNKSLLEHLKEVFVKRGGPAILKKIFVYRDFNGKGYPCSIRRSCLMIVTQVGKHGVVLQIPPLDPKDFAEVYKLIPLYLQFFPKEETEVAIVEYGIQLAIGNNSFDARLRGINELRAYIDRINSKDSHMFKFVTEDKLQDILKQSGFFEAMIDPRNFVSEIFKRSVPMIRLLSDKKYLTNAHITHIFKLAENRHESEVIVIFGVIGELASFVSPECLDHIFSEILKLRMNELTITLIKDFTIRAIDNLSRQSTFFGLFRRKKSSSKYDFYGANVLWKQIQDEGALEPALIPAAQDALKTIFASESFKALRDTYLAACLENIKKSRSFGQSIKLMLNILQAYSAQTPMFIGEGRNDIVQRLDKKYEILKAASNSLRKCSFPKISEQQSISYFFEFLEDYNSCLKQGLKVENLKSLWSISDNQTELLNFLRKPLHVQDKEYLKKTRKRLPHQLIRQLFGEVFLKGELMNNFHELSPQVFDTVDELFLAMHSEAKNLQLNDKNTIRLLNYPLVGVEFYENLLLANKFSKSTAVVINKSKKRYVELHLRFKDFTNHQKRLKLWNQLLERLLEMLPKNRQTMLPVLHEFLREVEGKMVRQNVQHTGSIEIEVRYDGKDKSIRLPRNSSIFRLRKLIIKEFGIDPSLNFSLEVCSNRKQVTFVEEEDYSVNALELAMKGPSIRVVDLKGRHPHLYALEQFKEEISHNERVYNLLVDLLSENGNNDQEVWDVLDLLPKNRNISDRLQQISTEYDSHKWRSFFGESSLKKLSYKLRILNELIDNPLWVSAFKATGGFDQLAQRMISFQKKDFLGKELIKCVSIALQTFFNCLSSNGVAQKDLLMNLKTDKIFQRLLEYLEFPSPPSVMLTNQILRLALKLIHSNPEFSNLLYSSQLRVEKLLEQGCFESETNENDLFIHNISQLFVAYTPSRQRVLIVESLTGKFLSLDYLQFHPKCEQYFMLLISCLEKLTEEEFGSLAKEVLVRLREFPSCVFSAGIKETSERDFNCIVYGAIRCKAFLIKKFPALSAEEQAADSRLVDQLVREYLFHESETSASHIQSHKNTVELYHLLQLLFRQAPASVQSLEKMLVPKLQKAPWRKLSAFDWMLEVERQQRRVYTGLRNLRATCYINCLLQQFYMIEPFREALMRLDCSPYNPVLKENEMYQLQKILSFLKYSNKGSYNPRQFCEAFRDYEGKPIDVNVQSDADEFFNAFLEKLENLLKVTKTPQIIDDVFRGTLSNQLVCEGCPHSSEREEQFMSLGVNIKNKPSLDEALKGFIEGEILDGDNAYFCQTCRKKVRTLKRLCIKHLPNILIVVMKRFEFNYDSMKKIKVNDYCSFPTELDMRKFTAEHLAGKELMPNDYYEFKLRGVVVHYGSAEAGHYYSYIKDQRKQWYEFNDESITSFNPQDLPEETFGGSETFGSGQYGQMKSEKCRNAYLLFYEREATYNNRKQRTKAMLDFSELEGSDKPIKELALQDNSSFEFINIVFDQAFMNFVLRMLLQDNPSLSVCKMALIYFHTVLLRAKEKDQFLIPFCTKLEEFLRERKELAEWYINQMTRPFIREFFIDACKQTKYIAVGMARIAVAQVECVPDDIILTLLNFIVNPNEKRNMTPFARIILEVSEKPREREFLQTLLYPQRVMAILTADTNSKFEDLPQPSHEASEFGSIAEEKEKEKHFRASPCLISLIESLEHFDEVIAIEDLELIQAQMFDKSGKKTLGRMAAKKLRKLNEQENVKALNRWANKMLTGDDRDLRNYLFWMKETLDLNDDLQSKRVEVIVQKQLELMESCASTYYPFDNLFNFMIKMCTKHPLYKTELKRKLQIGTNPSNTSLNLIEVWVHKSGIASKLVYNEDWKAYKSKIAGSLPESSMFYDEKREQRKRQFDLTVRDIVDTKQSKKDKEAAEKDPTLPKLEPSITLGSDDELVDRSLSLPFNADNQQLYRLKLYGRTNQKVRVIGRAGMLYRINVEGTLRWYYGDRDDLSYDTSGY